MKAEKLLLSQRLLQRWDLIKMVEGEDHPEEGWGGDGCPVVAGQANSARSRGKTNEKEGITLSHQKWDVSHFPLAGQLGLTKIEAEGSLICQPESYGCYMPSLETCCR